MGILLSTVYHYGVRSRGIQLPFQICQILRLFKLSLIKYGGQQWELTNSRKIHFVGNTTSEYNTHRYDNEITKLKLKRLDPD